MANNDDLILRSKALKDLRGIKDVLTAQGDPFLANIMHRAIECIENQPKAAEYVNARVATLEADLAAAMEYIRQQKACESCKWINQQAKLCAESECASTCKVCKAFACTCKECENGSNWEWRGAHGR